MGLTSETFTTTPTLSKLWGGGGYGLAGGWVVPAGFEFGPAST